MSSTEALLPTQLQVVGPIGESSPIPEDWPVVILKRATSRNFDGMQLLELILNIDWPAILQDVGIGVFSSWVYDQFARRETGAVSKPAMSIRITVDDQTTRIEIACPEDLEDGLRGTMPGGSPQ